MTLAVTVDPIALDTGFVRDTDFARALTSPPSKLVQYPDHILPVTEFDEFARTAKDPHFNAWPLMSRDPEVKQAIATVLRSLAEDPRAEVGPLIHSGYYSLENLPGLLRQAVASEGWAQRAADAWEIVAAELLRNTHKLCSLAGTTTPMTMLAIGSSKGRGTHCDSGGLVYCEFLGQAPTLGYNDSDVRLDVLHGRQGPVIVPRLQSNAEPIRFEGAEALFLRGYGNPAREQDISYDQGKPFAHNAPDPKDPVRPFEEATRLLYVAVI